MEGAKVGLDVVGEDVVGALVVGALVVGEEVVGLEVGGGVPQTPKVSVVVLVNSPPVAATCPL